MDTQGNESRKTYLVYPPGDPHRFKWKDLKDLFLSPKDYGIGRELEGLAKLGYTVDESDHELVDGPKGGGVIIAKRDTKRWFPSVLLRREYTWEIPPGFPRHRNYSCFALVPKIQPEHKLGIAPMPSASSPHFSVEPLAANLHPFLTIGFSGEAASANDVISNSFPELGLSVKPVDNVPNALQTEFEPIRLKGLKYSWFQAEYGQLEFQAWLAANIYLGLSLARVDGVRLRKYHIFSPRFIAGVEYPTAREWTSTKGVIRKVSHW